VSAEDRERWDNKYAQSTGPGVPGLPKHFEPFAKRFGRARSALDIACGTGRASVWLAQQGVRVVGYDISPTAVAQASALAVKHDVAHLCRFAVADFDDGLPEGPRVDLVFCNMFRSTRLDGPAMDRLNRRGLLALAALSEVGGAPGRFRVKPGELVDAFSPLRLIDHGEGDGVAWIVGRRRLL